MKRQALNDNKSVGRTKTRATLTEAQQRNKHQVCRGRASIPGIDYLPYQKG